jgi:hypothetical protein
MITICFAAALAALLSSISAVNMIGRRSLAVAVVSALALATVAGALAGAVLITARMYGALP